MKYGRVYMTFIIEAQNLIKHFNHVAAVDGVNFALKAGVCFGLLGPNGAGKTTTIEMLEGLIPPTEGNIYFHGKKRGNDFKEHAGIMFQSTALQEFITVKETLQLFTHLYPKPADIDSLIDKCALSEFLHRDTTKLSGGQRQRLLLAIALINNPTIIFLDEPTTGLDPQSRRNFWELVHDIKAQNKTIILTTHYMEEAYELCDEIAIMDHGKIITRGSPEELLAQHFKSVVLQLPADEIDIDTSQLPFTLIRNAKHMEFECTDVNSALQLLLQHNIDLTNLRIRSHTLDDLFLKLTGHQLRT